MKNRAGLFSLLKKQSGGAEAYDADKFTPVIRAGICTGEKTAGFLDNGTGRFREVMLIRNSDDLAAFRKKYGVEGEIKTIY